MLTRMTRIVVVVAILMATTLALAADQKATGTIIHVTQKVFQTKGDDGSIGFSYMALIRMKGADGKRYEIKTDDAAAVSLKPGDTIEYELVDGLPAHLVKKATK
jgi:hypothetical protein